MAPCLIFYLLKVLSILSAKIRSERAFPGCHDAIFSNRKLLCFKCTCAMTSSWIFCIANEGNSEQGASRQNLKSIEICFNSSHRGKIEVYLDRIH